MKKALVVLLLIASCYIIQFSCKQPTSSVEAIKELLGNQVNDWKKYLADTLLVLSGKATSTDSLRASFLHARVLYKKIEWFTEYFMPTTTRFVNGPPLPEVEIEENKIYPPEGLQVIETLLYPAFDTVNKAELIRQVKLLISSAHNYQSYLTDLSFSDSHIFDALRLQVFRIITLGISGFDAPLAKSSLSEAEISIQCLRKVLKQITSTTNEWKQLDKAFDKALTYLAEHKTFDEFDRLTFIAEHANALSKLLAQLQKSMRVGYVTDSRMLVPQAQTMFEEGVFDVNALVVDSQYNLTEAKARLGEKLFNDNILSGNSTRSCASCHQPVKAFTDGLPKSVSFTNGHTRRNAPTLLNAALQPVQFYDMRASTLENQAFDVINNKDEMHGSLDKAFIKINKDTSYVNLIREAFPGQSQVNVQHLQNALGSYIRTLVKLNSRFDEFMRGDKTQLNQEERLGFNLFMGKAKCGTCHFMPLFNGTVPPMYRKMDSEVLGVPATKEGKQLDDDPGRYAMTALEPYRNAFKTTTVRNAALTAPYMHNGVFNTLNEVIAFYDNGGGSGLGFKIENQTLPTDKLRLSKQEIKALVAFIHSLSDKP
jgi:cytochrome c peroxidase